MCLQVEHADLTGRCVRFLSFCYFAVAVADYYYSRFITGSFRVLAAGTLYDGLRVKVT